MSATSKAHTVITYASRDLRHAIVALFPRFFSMILDEQVSFLLISDAQRHARPAGCRQRGAILRPRGNCGRKAVHCLIDMSICQVLVIRRDRDS